ncbi:MAG: multiheme c-type cytochrome, partial [Bryobacteraceae bacterium]
MQAQQPSASPYAIHTGESSISSPGNAETVTGGTIRPGAFPSAEYCARCHKQAYSEWRETAHANSFREPFYRTSVNILLRTKGIKFTRHCDSCHNPIGVVSGALAKTNSNVSRTFDNDSLTCMTCHSIMRLQPTYGNGGYVMGIPSAMVDANGKRIPGEVPDAEIMAHPERHARAVMRNIYHSPKFCAACHKANLPYTLNGYKWIRAFTAYDEWQNSKFSHQNPLNFYPGPLRTCQNCHMMRELSQPGEYGAKKGTFASHRWLAGNTGVPFYYGYRKQLKKTIEFLQSGMYLNVDLFGLKLQNSGCAIEPLGSEPFTLAPSQTVQVWVVIQNKNIGHSLIPEVRDLYQAWVEFEVKDAAGRDIYHSGFLNADGTVDARAHTFTNRPVDSKGEFVDNHKVWTIHSVAYDNT